LLLAEIEHVVHLLVVDLEERNAELVANYYNTSCLLMLLGLLYLREDARDE
jgi:hypothetical protein